MAAIIRPAKASLRGAPLPGSTPSPRVSVIIPTHNRAGLVTRAISSALAQTMSGLEVIVVNDGSTDDTADVLSTIDDPRVRTAQLPGNSGVSRARNVGIAHARGEWVAFLDDDDEWLPHKLEAQLGRVEASVDPKTRGVYCGLRYIHPKTPEPLPGVSHAPEGQILVDLLLPDQIVSTSAFIVRRDTLLEAGGFDESLEAVVDRDLWLRLAQAGHHFVAVPERLAVLYRSHSSRITADPVALIRGQASYQRRWGGLERSCLDPALREAIMWNRRRQLERLHRKQMKRLLRSCNRRRAWRYAREVAPAVRMFPWMRMYVAKALTIVVLGQRARQFVDVPRRSEPPAPEAASAQIEADSSS